MSDTTHIEAKSVRRFRPPKYMPSDEIMFATLQRRRLNGSRLHLDDETRREVARLNSLHNVGIHRHFEDPEPKTLAIKLRGVDTAFSSNVVAEITREERSQNPLVRAIVDKRLGVVHGPGHPLAAEEPSVITITTLEPKRVVKHLSNIPFVHEVNALN